MNTPLAIGAMAPSRDMSDAERLAAIVALCQRYNTPAVNPGTHALANKILEIATGKKSEHK